MSLRNQLGDEASVHHLDRGREDLRGGDRRLWAL